MPTKKRHVVFKFWKIGSRSLARLQVHNACLCNSTPVFDRLAGGAHLPLAATPDLAARPPLPGPRFAAQGAIEYAWTKLPKVPVVFTDATEDVTFTRPAPGVLDGAQYPQAYPPVVVDVAQPDAPACGEVKVEANGSLVLKPANDFNGDCDFAFTYRDGEGANFTVAATVVFGELQGRTRG